MNRTVAAVYGLTIGGALRPEGGFTDQLCRRLVDECMPALVDEVLRQEKILSDPFIRGYLEAKASGAFHGPPHGNGASEGKP